MEFVEYVAESLEVKLPEEYAKFIKRYGEKLAVDPVNQESLVSGLGDSAFVVGTTQAFRARRPHFPMENDQMADFYQPFDLILKQLRNRVF